jgi:hypothetical protein
MVTPARRKAKGAKLSSVEITRCTIEADEEVLRAVVMVFPF